jgi:hypothetical protein
MDGPFADLEQRGYVVVRDFLPAELIESLRQDYSSQTPDPVIPYLKNASAGVAALAKPHVDAVLEQVRAETALKVNLPAGQHYFATGKQTGMTFAWHQDHESWFFFQNHYDYLNFYIPIIKPDVTRSNLRIVPFDVLERKAPRRLQDARAEWRVPRAVGGRPLVRDERRDRSRPHAAVEHRGLRRHTGAGRR